MKRVRAIIQSLFLLLTAAAGVQFYLFYRHLQYPGALAVPRPPMVEGFLPISATLAFRQWIGRGVFDAVHPAGLVLFLLIFGSALVAGRAFCSWICPVGTVSEAWGNFGRRVLVRFGRKSHEPGRLARFLLHALKYLLLTFFIYVCWFALNLDQVVAFLASPYNQVADLKMLLFFLEPGLFTILVLLVLVVTGFLVRNFWCRFICPYGAALGLLGQVAPVRLIRNKASCDQCGACARVCPNAVNPGKVDAVRSLSCNLCLSCVGACRRSALSLRLGWRRWLLQGARAAFFGIALALVFVGISALMRATGPWESSLTAEDLGRLLPEIRTLRHY